ncbi:MAG: nucleotidyltransferase domain-containing protein [Candidatus Omnitrophota bacterium]|nr:nucleotidyltransferase domain-containing protein [Candidatus Omnitrophota bacterium]
MVLLGSSKLRRKLLAYSFTHPDEGFYVRELASLIGEDAGNLSRELKRMEAEGLYQSIPKGPLRIYTLNKAYPLFKELKEIVFKTEGVEGSLRELVRDVPGVDLALLYGSYAKGTEKGSSDIDLIVVGKFPRNDFTRAIRALESKLNREINFTAYTPEEFAQEGRKQGGFLSLVLKDKIILLKGHLNGR